MNKTYFISDLHLGDETREINSAFFQFIERLATQANNVDALYVLGDFFEMWIGDDNQTELSDRVAECLSNLSSLGIKIYFIHGNRDFLIKKTLCQKMWHAYSCCANSDRFVRPAYFAMSWRRNVY
jgi:UDP-2,3-diacylglucosamine hydrolase